MELPAVTAPDKDQRLWATLAHLSAFTGYVTLIGFVLGPLLVWLLKRDGNPFVDDQAKEALNYQITLFIVAIIAVLFCITIIGLVIGVPLLWALPFYHVLCMIVAAVKSNEGVAFRYPLTIRFIK